MTTMTRRPPRGAKAAAILGALAALLASWLVLAPPAAASAEATAQPRWPVLRAGNRFYDFNVQTAQYLLRHHGYRLAADGLFGPATERTVRRFQRDRRLAVDGVIGPRTWDALVVPAGRGTAPGDLVRALQVQLVKNGYELAVDGVFGSRTEAATLRAERDIGGRVNGVLDKAEWQNLVWRIPD